MDGWINLKEAADRMGYSTAYFREMYCNSTAPLVTIHERVGPKGAAVSWSTQRTWIASWKR